MTRTVRLALIGVALVVVIILAWFFLLNPIRADISSTSAQIDDARASLAAAQAKLAQAETTRAEGKRNQARLIELAKMVPSSEEIPSLLVGIQDLAAQSGITFMAISPGTPIDANGFRIIPLAVQFTGTFFDVSDFIWRAEQMVTGPGRLLAIKQLSLQLATTGTVVATGASTSPVLAVTMTIYAFDTAPSAKAGTAATVPATEPSSTTSSTISTGI